jgi:hypothetical protein
MALNRKHVGGSFDDFLKEEGIYEEVQRDAAKLVLAFQFREAMKKAKMTKQVMASRMRTSRSSLDRILDPKNSGVTLNILERAAAVFGGHIQVKFVCPKVKRTPSKTALHMVNA